MSFSLSMTDLHTGHVGVSCGRASIHYKRERENTSSSIIYIYTKALIITYCVNAGPAMRNKREIIQILYQHDSLPEEMSTHTNDGICRCIEANVTLKVPFFRRRGTVSSIVLVSGGSH